MRQLILAGICVTLLVAVTLYSRKDTSEHLFGVTASERAEGVKRSSKWPTFRKHWLEKHNSCAACGIASDLQVHHIVPFHKHPELELSVDNVITLCGPAAESHHLTLGHGDNYKCWNPSILEDCIRFRSTTRAKRDAMLIEVKSRRLCN